MSTPDELEALEELGPIEYTVTAYCDGTKKRAHERTAVAVWTWRGGYLLAPSFESGRTRLMSSGLFGAPVVADRDAVSRDSVTLACPNADGGVRCRRSTQTHDRGPDGLDAKVRQYRNDGVVAFAVSALD